MRLFRELVEFLCACFITYVVGWLLGVGFVLGSITGVAYTLSLLF